MKDLKVKSRQSSTQNFISNRKTGKVLYKSELPSEEVAINLLEAEQYLNSEVAKELYHKFHIGFRFHF